MVERIAWVPARHHKMTGLGEICGALETLTAADDTCRLVTLADVQKNHMEKFKAGSASWGPFASRLFDGRSSHCLARFASLGTDLIRMPPRSLGCADPRPIASESSRQSRD
jgi:hypothetical protein